mmetsp:Transcript_139942/g.390134  ORF Transcript_139942/g.390134 Transcript_139942/m.390134 type:complete len:400 (-) Transcript_139942:102-1301(-)
MGLSCCKSDGIHALRAKSHLDENFGQGTADALQKVSELLGMVDKTISGGKSMNNPVLVNLGMILKQVEQERRYTQPITSQFKFGDVKVMRKAARYARFASASYFEDKKNISEYIGSLSAEDIKYLHNSDSPLCPSFFVAADPETGEIVLCIRGTSTAADALSDVVCTKEPFLGGRAHSGILESAKHVVEAAKDHVVRLSQESPRKSIAIVGHSLAAGTAVLTTILLSGDGSPFSRLMAAAKVKCFAFAPPPVFEPLWALPPWVHASTYSFVNNMDCVPRACLGTLSKLFLAMKQVDALPMTPLQRLAFLRGDYELEHQLPDYVEIPQELQTSLGSLFGVGMIILFYRGEDGQTHCETITPAMTDRILLHPDMVNDHLMSGYEKSTAEVCAQLKSKVFCC